MDHDRDGAKLIIIRDIKFTGRSRERSVMKRGERKVDAPVRRRGGLVEEPRWRLRARKQLGPMIHVRLPYRVHTADRREKERERGPPLLKRDGVNSNEFRLSSSFPSNLPRNNLLTISTSTPPRDSSHPPLIRSIESSSRGKRFVRAIDRRSNRFKPR